MAASRSNHRVVKPNLMRSSKTSQPTVSGIYTGTQCQQLDLLAASALNIPTLQLMERAGVALLAQISARYRQANQLLVCCGTGNNAGDGYVLARLALQQGWLVQLLQIDGRQLTGDAGLMQQQAQAAGLMSIAWTDTDRTLPKLTRTTVVVDALLGTSVVTQPRPSTLSLMQAINGANDPSFSGTGLSGKAPLAVVAVDIPSGVNPASTGLLSDAAIRADFTLTFLGRKLCLVSGAGVAYTGTLALATLGAPPSVYEQLPGLSWRHFNPAALPQRLANTHKHQQGRVVVVGGDLGMGGAVAMAAEAALRVGAGLVTVITRAEHLAPILSRRPELMVIDAQDLARCRQALSQADVVVVGPGLGRGGWGRALFAEVMAIATRTLIDADGISLLAEYVDGSLELDGQPMLLGERIITPHAGEAARLLGLTSAEVESDRQAAVLALVQCAQAVALLKGPGTLIAEPSLVQSGAQVKARVTAVCAQGNAAMATAGMGDVLAGVIAGLWAQGLEAVSAAEQGACWHAATADHLVASGQRSLLATQVLEALDVVAAGQIVGELVGLSDD